MGSATSLKGGGEEVCYVDQRDTRVSWWPSCADKGTLASAGVPLLSAERPLVSTGMSSVSVRGPLSCGGVGGWGESGICVCSPAPRLGFFTNYLPFSPFLAAPPLDPGMPHSVGSSETDSDVTRAQGHDR